MADDLSSAIWNPAIASDGSSLNSIEYRSILLEQYKVYVEMADRVSSRRGLANSFFLTLNVAVIGLSGPALKVGSQRVDLFFASILLVILLAQCAVWVCVIRSYRTLNKAKYEVIGAMEERLPARIYSKGEWLYLVRGGRIGRYASLSVVEQLMPAIFSVAYILLFARICVD
ncbi:RipA family octameric membrane protein [Kitasatospora purpeofusca]